MIEIRLGPEYTDFDAVHSMLANSYWSPGISKERVERAAARTSLVVNAYVDGSQVGYARVISDRTTFAWLADVIVHPDFQGRGVGKAMLQAAFDDPDHQGLRRWVLATKDAHSLYEKFGFEPIPNPEHWMIRPQKPSPNQ
ncbi:MAG: GNAT family N-acetyltransferase [Fimbriimonadaceae bacterium]|nr:GNAT family N-acetyltransferase [Fimbriimonadaceae bacterium]